MKHVVFLAPYFGANIRECLRGLLELEEVRVGVITQESADRVPSAFRSRLDGHYQVRDAIDPAQLARAVRAFWKEWGRVDRLLGYMEEMQLPLARVREALGIPGMSHEVALNFRDKHRMKGLLARAGLPVARQARIAGPDDARRFAEAAGYPLVLKPLAGVGTRHTFRVDGDEELLAALNRLLPSARHPAQAEEFVSGSEHTFETVCVRGEPVWDSSTFYLPGPLEVVENPWMQYCVLLPRERRLAHVERFAPLNHAALRVLGLETGLTHMEWFHTRDDREIISEVAARPPGVNIMKMLGMAHEVDFWGKWAGLMVHERFEMPPRRWACGCAFFRGQGRGRRVAAVEGLAEALADLGERVVEARLPKVGQPRSSHYEGEGWALVRAEETAQVVDALRRLVTNTRVRYA